MMLEEFVAALEAGDPVPADRVRSLGDLDRFGSATLGLVWDSLSVERIAAHLEVDERHLQPHGLVHGGVWCAIVESTASFGAALQVASTGQHVVGVSNSTEFLRGVREGRVDAEAVPLHVGRQQQLWQVDLRRAADGKLVARGQVRLQNLDPAAPSA